MDEDGVLLNSYVIFTYMIFIITIKILSLILPERAQT